MNPPPQRGPSRYGGGGGGGSAQGRPFPYVDPAEGQQAAGGVRPFFPAPEGGGEPPPPKPPSAERAQRWYGGGGADEISLGHGHGVHRYHQFGVETGNDDGGGSSGSQLPRHSGSPPGFFSSSVVDNVRLRSARVGAREGDEVHRHVMSSCNKKLKSPMNLGRQGTLSQISEDGISDLTENIHGAGHSEENVTASNVVHSFTGFSIGSWEDSNSIAFTTSKTGIPNNDDIITTLSNYELQFGLTKETARVLHMQQDQVPFRVRAKRGCATHPRSIAERERRTRISEKLRNLQSLVPNMDKQTSTADMLDLAVEYIRGLHSELQTLKEEKEKCTCRANRQSRN